MSSSARTDDAGGSIGHHSRSSSNASMNSLPPQPSAPPPPHVGHVPPVVVPAPPVPSLNAGRFSPSDHVSPEITHSANPLHQLLQQQQHFPPQQQNMPQPPLPGGPQMLHQHQHQFLQQFMSSNGTHGRNLHVPPTTSASSGPLPPPPSSAPPVMYPSYFQVPNASSVPSPPQPVARHPIPPVSQFHAVPSVPVVRSVSGPTEGTRGTVQHHHRSSSINGAGSSTSSLNGSPRRGNKSSSNDRPGMRVSGEQVDYQTQGGQANESQSLEVMPITLYNSERTSQLGNLISVNEHFISYPIRNGLIRVISQNSVDRLLLRKHENHAVTELSFFNGKTDLLVSSGTDNHIAVWSIVEDPMSRELLKLIPTAAQLVKWHPSDTNKLAIVNENTVFITDLTNVDADGEGAKNIYDISVVCRQTSSQINAITFSPGGDSVITGGNDGFVHVYRVSGRQIGEPAEFVHRFEPFQGEPVNSLHLYGGNYLNQLGLLIGGEGNTRLSLWNAPLSESVSPTCVQNVNLLGFPGSNARGTSAIHETMFDQSSQFLFVADRSNPLIYALHLADSANSRTPRHFDNVTEFTLAYPVLSMAILNRAPGQTTRDDLSSGDEDFSMQLYCLQTQAIQRYYVAASDCYIPSYHQQTAGSFLEDDQSPVKSSIGQTVGAMTTEGETAEMSYQAAAESPRASAASAAPETEIDVQTNPQSNGDLENEDDEQVEYQSNASGSIRRSPNGSPVRLGSSSLLRSRILTEETGSSVAGETGGSRSYARSSPSSSVRAFHDESSVQYEPSLDDAASESQQTILSFLRRMEVNQNQRDEILRDQMRVVMGNLGNHLTAQVAAQVEKSIQKQLQTILVPAMGRIVLHTMENNFMKPVQNGFQHVISEKLIPQMEMRLNESLASALPAQMGGGVEEMVQRVVEDVRQPVRESFRECFQEIIIPSFQAATQKMFEQINDTFIKGTRSALACNGQDSSNAQVANQLKQLIEVVDDLSSKVDALAGSLPNGTGIHSTISRSPEELQFESQKSTVLNYVEHKNYEEAFKFALGAQNVNLVAFTCQQCDPREVLCCRPPKLSQMIILCLVQQLGADLADDLQTKLSWLRESLLVMDVRDQTIAGFVTGVLQELQTGLNSVPAEYRDSQYTLLHHILNSLLSSA